MSNVAGMILFRRASETKIGDSPERAKRIGRRIQSLALNSSKSKTCAKRWFDSCLRASSSVVRMLALSWLALGPNTVLRSMLRAVFPFRPSSRMTRNLSSPVPYTNESERV